VPTFRFAARFKVRACRSKEQAMHLFQIAVSGFDGRPVHLGEEGMLGVHRHDDSASRAADAIELARCDRPAFEPVPEPVGNGSAGSE
jgi:hypothetical protein